MKKVYDELLKNIPDYQAFLTVEEMDESSKSLAAAYPDIVSLSEIGRTRESHPLLCLKIGEGSRNALVFGLPHPNEPIGTMLLEYFTWQLAENEALRKELDYTWYFVKAWDADGTKLNENWFKGPYTITNYMRNFFRPAGYEQVDWTFPIDYKELHFHEPLPETVAMMKLIDEIKPRFIYSLHNAGFGGVYWYVSAPPTGLIESLHRVPDKYNVPMHLGEPESESSVVVDQAIYLSLGLTSVYDHMEKYGGIDMKNINEVINCGDCSASYAREKYNSFTLLTELPYFDDPRIKDLSLSDMTRKDAVLQKVDEGLALSMEIVELANISKGYFSLDNHFYLAAENFISNPEEHAIATRKMVADNPEYNMLATVAEKFDNLLIAKFYKALVYALLLRANETELEKMTVSGEVNPEKKAALKLGFARTYKSFDKITKFLEENMNYSVVPIKNLIGIQLECGLLMAEHLKEHPEI